MTAFSKAVALSPSRRAWGARDSTVGKLLWAPPIASPPGDFGGRRAPRRLGWDAGAVPRSRPTVGGEDRNNGQRRLAEDLREKKNPLFTATAWATSLGLLPHASSAKMGNMGRPHTLRRPSQANPEASSPRYPSPSPPDTVQRDREPIQEHRRGASSVTELPRVEPFSGLVLGDREASGEMHWGWAGERARRGRREDRNNKPHVQLGLQERSTKINQG